MPDSALPGRSRLESLPPYLLGVQGRSPWSMFLSACYRRGDERRGSFAGGPAAVPFRPVGPLLRPGTARARLRRSHPPGADGETTFLRPQAIRCLMDLENRNRMVPPLPGALSSSKTPVPSNARACLFRSSPSAMHPSWTPFSRKLVRLLMTGTACPDRLSCFARYLSPTPTVRSASRSATVGFPAKSADTATRGRPAPLHTGTTTRSNTSNCRPNIGFPPTSNDSPSPSLRSSMHGPNPRIPRTASRAPGSGRARLHGPACKSQIRPGTHLPASSGAWRIYGSDPPHTIGASQRDSFVPGLGPPPFSWHGFSSRFLAKL